MPPAPRSLTHLGVPVGDLVNLITETSPTPPGSVVPLSFILRADGSGEPFTLPAQTVFVLTDVVVTMPRGGAAPGRYVAGICNTPCANSRVPIQVHTDVDGFQKTRSIQKPTRPSWLSAPWTITTLGCRTRTSFRASCRSGARSRGWRLQA